MRKWYLIQLLHGSGEGKLSNEKRTGRQREAIGCTLHEMKSLRMGGTHVFAIAHTCQRGGLGRGGNGRYCSASHRGYSCSLGRTALPTHWGVHWRCVVTFKRTPA